VLTNFFYSHPVWLVGLLVVGVWTGLSLLGLVIFNKFVDVHIRHKDTETVGLTYAIVAVVYAVLIAFIVVNVFETFSKSDEIVIAEANRLSSLMLDSDGLPPQMAAIVRTELNEYIDIVVNKEWPSQQAGNLDDKVFEPGWEVLGKLNKELASFEPTTSGQNVNKAEMLSVVNELTRARRSRIDAAGEHLADVVWQILILAGIICVVYTYLFGAHNFRIHIAITGLVAALIALVFVLIIALDYPFRGEVSVGDEAYVNVRTAAGTTAAEPAPAVTHATPVH
jgi:hypothetical protein